MIYLDNAATSWPKPDTVHEAVSYYLREVGANPGRMVAKTWHQWPGRGKRNDPGGWPADLRIREMPK